MVLMNRKLLLAVSIIPVFILIYVSTPFFVGFLWGGQPGFSYFFLVFITGIALLMLSSIWGEFCQCQIYRFCFFGLVDDKNYVGNGLFCVVCT